MRILLLGLLVALAGSVSAQAAPYDPYPWCAAYGGSWSGTSNCGFRTLQQCMATVSGRWVLRAEPILQSSALRSAS